MTTRTALRAMLPTAAIAAASLAATGAGAGAQGAGEDGPLAESPPGEALVIDVNLQEVFRGPDVDDPTDMRNFARLLGERVPYDFPPDVLLLQEVRRQSAGNVARFMRKETGDRYEVVVDPGDDPWLAGNRRRETAVLINAETMRVEDEGGFVTTANRAGRRKDNAYALVKERRGGLRLPVMSVHWAHRGDSVARAEQLAQFLDGEYPSPSARQVEVIAGDFNTKRCQGGPSWKWESLDCAEQAWYQTFTEKYGYTDAVLAASPEEIPQAQRDDVARIDFIFARGEVVDAGSDLQTKRELRSLPQCAGVNGEYFKQGRGDEAPEPCRSLFYTDHRLLWALVGMEQGERDR